MTLAPQPHGCSRLRPGRWPGFAESGLCGIALTEAPRCAIFPAMLDKPKPKPRKKPAISDTVLTVEQWPIGRLVGYPGNPRKNDSAVDRMCEAIRAYGFRIPIVAKSDGLIVDGHLRHKAALKLGLKTVPVALADELTENQIKAFRLLANQSASWAEWDMPLLKMELESLQIANYPLQLTGFGEVELVSFMSGIPNFEPGTEDEQGRLDQLAPMLVKCPHCGEEFNGREHVKK